MFVHVQSIQTSRIDTLCFFSNVLFNAKCAPFLLKIRKDFNIDIKRVKTFDIMKIVLSTFGSKVFLHMKIIDFENVLLTKIVHVYVIKGINA
jgi:hypothetical protein